MNLLHSLQTEFAHEAHKTRQQLERLPGDKLAWRPHAKSFTAGALAGHLIDCLRWTTPIFQQPVLDLNPATYQPCQLTSVAELLPTFDAEVARCQEVLAQATDNALVQPWQLKINGQVYLEKLRWDVFRDFTLSHLIHHRGQLSVYLRLLEVPVPGAYGPTADEQ